MKTVDFNPIFSLSICIIISLTAGCDKPYSTVPSAEETHNIGAKPFQNEIYRSIDNRQAITIVSPDELELHENGANLICKYSKQDGRLRVVANIMGTTQALYYEILPTGMRSNNGSILFNSENYQRITTAIRETNERKAMEQAHLDSLIASSKHKTRVCWNAVNGDHNVSVTDASIKFDGQEVFFAEIHSVDPVIISLYEPHFFIDYDEQHRASMPDVRQSTEVECRKLRTELIKAYSEWKLKFPTLAHAVFK